MYNYHHPSGDEIDDMTDTAALANDDYWTANVGKQMSIYPKLVWWPAESWTSIKAWLDAAFSRGGEPLLMLCNSSVVGRWDNPRNWINSTWTSGSHDTALNTLIDNIKNYSLDHIVHIRFFWEGNRNVQLRPLPYDPVNFPEAGWYADLKNENGVQLNTPTTFKDAWRYIVNKFKTRGASNARFWFTVGSYGNILYNGSSILSQMYPEDVSHQCVDNLGYEIYANRITTNSYLNDPNITYTYPALAALNATKPIFVVESGCQSKPGDAAYKPAWLGNTLNPALIKAAYPRTCGILYWDDLSILGDGTKFDLKDTVAAQNMALARFGIADYRNGYTGPFLSAVNGGGANAIPNRMYPYGWEQFKLTKVSGSWYYIQSYDNHYLFEQNAGGAGITFEGTYGDIWNRVLLTRQTDGYYTMKCYDNVHFICAENGGETPINATRTSAGIFENWGFHNISGNVYNIWTKNYPAYGPRFQAMPTLSIIP